MAGWKHSTVSQRLGLRLPIVQGPFGGGLSSVALVAAVSEAGGLGSFGAHHLDGDGILRVSADIRAQTAKPFALNLWVPFEDSDDPQLSAAEFTTHRDRLAPYFKELGADLPAQPARFMPRYAEQVEAIWQARPAVLSFVFGAPAPEVVDRCRELGIVTIGAATTVDEAIALEAAGLDMLVATGFEAGGHRVAFLQQPERGLTGLFALLPQVRDAVRIPVIAAGGIADGRGIAAARLLGADAVQIGTAFLACEESGTHALHREALFSPAARHTELTRAFSGRLARGIRNRFVEESRGQAVAPYPVQNWLTGQLKKAAQAAGRTDLGSLWCGQAAPLLKVRHATALMQQLEQETDALLG
ncbi:NAD(P)H-dependent flavin oxidoreductase [Leeia aquatica]|uniref:Nitronate monooxygenase n=1 Tax=Leeia aquatica TaxID=2725557 RepID=A0A847S1B0_9NEIS|nr:nitronate monooxygenase [Leeia aquatica]NLR75641.1 hypothetical protein [Leeia aquatica]